jgi:hypothetical protein
MGGRAGAFAAWGMGLLLLAACAGGSSGGGGGVSDAVTAPVGSAGATVATPSGKASLTIPSGALSSDTDITIERLDGRPPHGSVAGAVEAGGAYYRLSPDGLVFDPAAGPVTFAVSLDGAVGDDGSGNPVVPPVALLHVASDGTATPLDNARVTVDIDAGTATVSGELSHFSGLEFRLGSFGSIRVTGVPARLDPGAQFTATTEVTVGTKVKNDLQTLDVVDAPAPVFPVLFLNAASDGWGMGRTYTVQSTYLCNDLGGNGLFQSLVSVKPINLDFAWKVDVGGGTVTDVPADFFVTEHLFQKKVACMKEAVPEVSFMLPSEASTAENGAFALAGDLSAPLNVDLMVPVGFSGTATEGEDWSWNGELDGGGIAFLNFPAGELHAEAEYRILDDTDVEGDESIGFHIDPDGVMPPGLVALMPPLDLGFTLTDDPAEPTLAGGTDNALMLFFANPAEVTKFVGESAQVEVSETLLNVPAQAQDIQVLLAVDDPSVLGVPSLVPPGPFDGTQDVTFDPAAGLLVSRLTVRSLFPTDANVQTVSFPCVGAGTATVTVAFFDLSQTPGTPTELAHSGVTVTCQAQEIVGWTSALDLGYAPEGFLGGIGPHVRTHNGPEGDPFADPQTVRHQALDVLGLPTDRDYALIADDNQIGVWDLLDGTEVERLALPFGPYWGGVFLVAPDSSKPPEWLVSYNDAGTYGETNYNPDSGEWGATQFFSSGGSFITDIVPGPLDGNGRDTGYVVVNYGTNTVIYRTWNAGLADWAPDPAQIRLRGAWGDAGGIALSAVGGFDGPALVLVHNGAGLPGSLWQFDPKEANNDNDQNIGSVGLMPYRLRCLRGVCVATNFDSDSVTTVSWTAPGATPVIRETHPVGDGPLDVDLIPDPAGGGVLALTTGYNDNSFTVTQTAADATVTGVTTTALTDCAQPGNGRFTDGTGSHVMVACEGSNRVVIVAR